MVATSAYGRSTVRDALKEGPSHIPAGHLGRRRSPAGPAFGLIWSALCPPPAAAPAAIGPVGKQLGEGADLGAGGGSAIVYLAEDAAKHTDVALKVMAFSRHTQQLHTMVRREVTFSAQTFHPNIVRLLDVIADSVRRQLVIVGPDLLELLNERGGALPEGEAAFYFAQVLAAVLFMHNKGFAHRDIKAENCVLERASSTVKLVDFGLTKHLESAVTLGVGTPQYMAPEMITGGGPGPPASALGFLAGASAESTGGAMAGTGTITRYDARCVDAWAMGTLLFVMVNASYPFEEPGALPPNTMALHRRMMAGAYRPLPAHVSAGCTAVVHGLLNPNPNARITPEELASNQWLLSSALSYAQPRGLQGRLAPLLQCTALRDSSSIRDQLGLPSVPPPAVQDRVALGEPGKGAATAAAAGEEPSSHGVHLGSEQLQPRVQTLFGRLFSKLG